MTTEQLPEQEKVSLFPRFRIAIIAGAVMLLLAIAFLGAMWHHLNAAVPVPLAVQRIQGLQQYASAYAALMPIVPNDPQQPAAIREKRETYNNAYGQVLRDLDRYQAEAANLPFDEAVERVESLHTRLLDMTGIFADDWKRAGGKWLPDPAYRRIATNWAQVQQRIDDARLEAYIRHGQWKTVALISQEANWDEGVYYWRQQGGIDAFWHIGAGGIEQSLRKKGQLKFLWKFLPFPDQGAAAVGGSDSPALLAP